MPGAFFLALLKRAFFMSFNELETLPNLPKQEKEILAFWKDEKIMERLKLMRSQSDEKVYYDGPITANGIPHYGHAITWTLKDIIPRFWSMKDNLVLRNMGWDCQGIPVEYEVEKELKLERKEDIEKMGVDKFNDLCRKSVLKYREVTFDYEEKLGRWFDPAVIYSTMEPKYIESIWWSLKELYKKGLLYEDYKVVAYSTRAGTSLSTHEVSEGGYKEVEDPFVTVKFKLLNEQNTFILAWTTTPWTIPGNLMLAVNEVLEYVKVSFEDAFYIVAKDRVENVFKDKSHTVLGTVPSKELIGKSYQPPFNYFEAKRTEGCFKVVASSHANVDEGTGIVHLAPYGAEDFEIFRGLGIKLFDYLNDTACFTDLIPEYLGLFYKKANPLIIKNLGLLNLLFDSGNILHRMPMCWRTGTPLIYKPIKSWYVAVTKIKSRLVEENQKTNWFPEHLKEGNSGIWLANARDWALSRNRYWCTPLPVWVNDKTGEKVFVGSFEELRKFSGVKLKDPHKPFVDEVTWNDSTGGTFRRVKDVIDVWYDSASMPFARHHYPFENKEVFEKSFPAEYIAEGPDQVRLWFYVMHVLGVALFNQIPYRNVVTIGTMLDESGKKMSKSKRNYKPMDEVLETYGGDVLRYFILTSPIVSGQDTIFTVSLLDNSRRDFFIPLWNCLKYFVTYANLYKFEPQFVSPDSANILDQWILSEFKVVVKEVSILMYTYKILEASKLLAGFVSDLSTWYIRRSRDRIKEGDLNALSTLYFVLSGVASMVAPFTPFFAETLFKLLKLDKLSGLKSVHHTFFPSFDSLTKNEEDLLLDMTAVRQICERGHSQRKEQAIKVRQPLNKLTIHSNRKLGTDLLELVGEELNVKSVELIEQEDLDIKLDFDTDISEELKLEGLARDLVRQLQEMRKERRFKVDDFVSIELEDSVTNRALLGVFEKYVKEKAKVKELKLGPITKIV